jgi:hypothetical protein
MSDVEVGWTVMGVLAVLFVLVFYLDRKRML